MYIIYILLSIAIISLIVVPLVYNKCNTSEKYLPGIRPSRYDEEIIKSSGGMAGYGVPYIYNDYYYPLYNHLDYYPQSLYNPYYINHIKPFRMTYSYMPQSQLDVYNRIHNVQKLEYKNKCKHRGNYYSDYYDYRYNDY